MIKQEDKPYTKCYVGIVNNSRVKGEKVVFTVTVNTAQKKYRFDSLDSKKGTHGWIPLYEGVGDPAGPVRAWNRWTGQNLDPEEVWS